MGPIALFDKSLLQSVSLDEAVWFDRFFLPVVCPVFYVETLADLAKEPSKHGPAEVTVRQIAQKFPELGGSPCGSHMNIAINDLLGFHTPMDGRVPRPGGRPVKSGTVYEQTPEEAAFQRWQEGKFEDVERIVAACWRRDLAELDLATMAKEFKSLGIDGKSCRTLEDAKNIARAVVNGTENVVGRLALAVLFLHIPEEYHSRIHGAWAREGRRPLNDFAPYAAHVLSVEIFFQVALAAGLIATERPSNRTDIAYLFYLPFCMVFVSSDKLHRRTAPLFMRPDQQFVWGVDLKPSLTAINQHFLALPESEREKGLMSFAHCPPAGNRVADLWDRYMRKGYREDRGEKLNPAAEAELVKRFKELRKQATITREHGTDADDEFMSIARLVRHKRGSWWQLPKGYRERDEGEED